jgi:hypothetical protein
MRTLEPATFNRLERLRVQDELCDRERGVWPRKGHIGAKRRATAHGSADVADHAAVAGTASARGVATPAAAGEAQLADLHVPRRSAHRAPPAWRPGPASL